MADISLPVGMSNVVSAAMAGLVSRAVTHPMDTVRAVLQYDRVRFPPSVSTFSAIRQILAQEGIRGLYRGYGVAMTFTAPASSLYFVTYEIAKTGLSKEYSQSAVVHFCSGLTAEAISGLLWLPMDVVKQRMQCQVSDVYKGSGFSAALSVVKTEGFWGLYKGYFTCLAAFGPYTALYFTVYEKCKVFAQHMYSAPSTNALPAYAYFVCGLSAATVAASVTNPLEIIKTRVQVDANSTARSIVTKLISEEGFRGLSRGVLARVLQMAPQSALSIGTYEYCKRLFSSRS
mmetsp:Transcript_32891/g.55507  ORF Transcript_32891/g.55507 Transcript_32891/m.55507 type:complete len:288 (+) Transcript_32891:210-1073(+)